VFRPDAERKFRPALALPKAVGHSVQTTPTIRTGWKNTALTINGRIGVSQSGVMRARTWRATSTQVQDYTQLRARFCMRT